jgi:hypothetical protein
VEDPLLAKLRRIDVNHLTLMQVLAFLAELKREAGE